MLYDTCLYDIYIYWNICMMKFLWNFILEFFFKEFGSCHGTGFVVAGGTAGCHNNLRCRQGWQSGLYGSSRLFNVQCIQCTQDLSHLAPIFHPKLSKMLHSSLVRAVFCGLRILMIVKPEFLAFSSQCFVRCRVILTAIYRKPLEIISVKRMFRIFVI